MATLLSSHVKVILPMVPLGIIAAYFDWNSVAVFTINFVAIIPLAALVAFTTEELAITVGDNIAALLSISCGNAIQLVFSIAALAHGLVAVVQASIIGSILSTLLLAMGMCFFFGALLLRDENGNGVEQVFSVTIAQTACSLLTVSTASLIIPTALYIIVDQRDPERAFGSVLYLSRGTAVILILLYAMYLWFQLRTHSNLFNTENDFTEEEGTEEAHIHPRTAVIILIITNVLIAICTKRLVSSIDNIIATANISKTFTSLILKPIVGNTARHFTTVIIAIRHKMNLAVAITMGSTIQISLGVIPFLVIIGWILDRPMTLRFEPFETVAYAISVLVITYIIQDGKSNYFNGAICLGFYGIIAIAFYTIPGDVIGFRTLFYSNSIINNNIS